MNESDKELTGKALVLLNNHYSRQFGWSTFFEVPVDKHRADFIAFNIYHSRGCPIIGCEIKASRSDWLSELKNCGKADGLIRNCDEWYICEAKKGIVFGDELPDGWGLLTPSGKGLKIKVKSNIPKATPPREFFARIIEHSLYAKGRYPSQMLAEAERRGYDRGKQEGVTKREYDNVKEKADVLDRLKENNIDFSLWRLNDIKKVKLAMDLLEHLENIEYNVGRTQEGCSAVLERITKTIETINEIKGVNTKNEPL